MIAGIRMGQVIDVEPAESRYRDMYGGAVTLNITAGGQCIQFHLDYEGARLLSEQILTAASTSECGYEDVRSGGASAPAPSVAATESPRKAGR